MYSISIWNKTASLCKNFSSLVNLMNIKILSLFSRYRMMSSWVEKDEKNLKEIENNFNDVRETTKMNIMLVKELSLQVDLLLFNLRNSLGRLEEVQNSQDETIKQLVDQS